MVAEDYEKLADLEIYKRMINWLGTPAIQGKLSAVSLGGTLLALLATLANRPQLP